MAVAVNLGIPLFDVYFVLHYCFHTQVTWKFLSLRMAPRNPQANAFIELFLAGVSRALLIFYLFFSPFFIEDELRRVDKTFEIAKLFLPLLAIIKLFFGFMHIILRSNSKEVTKLLLTMIFLSAMVLHSNVNTKVTFKDIYFNANTDGEQQPKPPQFLFLTQYFPFLDNIIASLPSVLDSENSGVGMTASVATLAINSTNLIAYHWLIIIGIVSSICCHMIAYEDYSRIGRLGLGVFYILMGISIMVLSEFQRAFMYFFVNYNLINESMDNQSALRVILVFSFICCGCGISLLTNTKYKKLGIFISIGYILILISYELNCLLIGQKKRETKGLPQFEFSDTKNLGDGVLNIDLGAMMKYHDKFIYPTDYQLLRLINLLMILSGTLFEMLKIYNPEHAQQSQADYSSVDDKEDLFDNAADDNDDVTNNDKTKRGKNNKNKNKNKNKKKKNNNQSKSEPKKQR